MYVGSRQALPSDLSIWNGSTVPDLAAISIDARETGDFWQLRPNAIHKHVSPLLRQIAPSRHVGRSVIGSLHLADPCRRSNG